MTADHYYESSPGTLPVALRLVVNGLARLLRQLEADWTPGLSLAHHRTGERVSVWGNVFDPHRDDIAASQLAINGEIEHCQLASSPFDLKLRPNGPDVPCQQRRFRPDQLPLVPGRAVGVGSSCHRPWSSSFGLNEDDMVRWMPNPLN
jgi:hypothetical protein